jgi:arylsulfatase
MYRPEDMPLPASGDPDVAQPRHVQWLMDERSSGAAKLNSPRLFAATARELQEMIALTFGMITNIDDRIGMVMETLKKCGVDQNTVVIFTADHGDLMGDHGIVLKGPLHYQGLVRVPFIWRDPAAASEAPAARRDDLVSSIDLAASILARAGISAPNGAQGKALFDPVGAGLPSGRDAVLIEENQQRAYMGFENPVRARTLVTARHRLTVFQEGDWGELYDLLEDPLELTNLWDEPEAASTRSTLLHRLARALIEHAETSPNPTRIA